MIIKNLVMDCDGTLTDGKYYYTDGGKFISAFHANDSMAIMKAKERGIKCIMISSGSHTGINDRRALDLGVMFRRCSVGKKLDLLRELGVNMDETAYIGDCLDDIPVLKAAAVGFVPSDALNDVKYHANFVLKRGGGQGCVLEAVLILEKFYGG